VLRIGEAKVDPLARRRGPEASLIIKYPRQGPPMKGKDLVQTSETLTQDRPLMVSDSLGRALSRAPLHVHDGYENIGVHRRS
jgi:hypothetical protein